MIFDLVFNFFEFIFGADIIALQPYNALAHFFSWGVGVGIFVLLVLVIPLVIIRKLYIKRRSRK